MTIKTLTAMQNSASPLVSATDAATDGGMMSNGVFWT
jgi:hypothetical protein